MHVLDIFICISIGQVMGWFATIYAETDHRRLVGNMVVTTAGAFVGGYLSISLISEFSKYSMIFSAFFVAGLFLYLVRYRSRLHAMYSDAKRRKAEGIAREKISFAKHGRPIIVTIHLVAVIFGLLGFFKSLQIKPQQFSGTDIDETRQVGVKSKHGKALHKGAN